MRILSARPANDRGATSIEYGLIIGFIGIVVMTSVTLLGARVGGTFTSAYDALNGSSGTTAAAAAVASLPELSGTTVMRTSATLTFAVIPAGLVTAGATLDRNSVTVASGGGVVVGRTFDGYVRLVSPTSPGSTVITFAYTMNGQTQTGRHTVTYA
ncbi:MAG: Flp family type IVb pilin [Actinobacteria bacterium]|nr:Flp family type IVb pilin [Actinomycetota bacterium]